MEKKQFLIDYDELPISVNNYLKPSAISRGGRIFVHMYETKESKDWKKRFVAYLKREIKKQNWDKSITAKGHWYLDCVFYQSRTNQDSNNFFKILCDALKEGGAIEDDKNLLVRPQKVMYDAKHPRFMAVLHPVQYIGIFNNKSDYDDFVKRNCSRCKKNMETCTILRKAKEGRVQDEIQTIDKLKTCLKRKI